jgi:ABC-type antimicrobial peptide transport system permease subunit
MSGSVEWRAVTANYFRTLGIGLVAGRVLDETDVEGRPPVAIVNQTFARRYFLDRTAIGQRIEIGRFRGVAHDPTRVGPVVEIVGVVKDIRDVSLRAEPARTIYVPQAQAPNYLSNIFGRMPSFIARRRSTSGDVQRAVTEAFRAADSRLPKPQVLPLDDLVAQSLVRERFGAALVSAIAAVALALTAFGVYGVLAYTVQQRRREIGIRIALGADGGRITRQVVMHGVVPVLLGIMLGMAGSLGLSRLLAGYLWGVKPTDVPTLATTVAILLGVSSIATWIPARNAARLDPVKVLNSE